MLMLQWSFASGLRKRHHFQYPFAELARLYKAIKRAEQLLKKKLLIRPKVEEKDMTHGKNRDWDAIGWNWG